MIALLLILNLQARTTFDQIVVNKPKIDRVYAAEVAEQVDLAADKYKVPANVIAGIFMVESSYKLNAVNKRSSDFGIGQVNIWHVRKSKLDKDRLLNDLEYSVDQSVRIFQWFYKRYKLDRAIRRYNCGTVKNCINWKGPRKYLRKVWRYM